jgi:hypothetical protein
MRKIFLIIVLLLSTQLKTQTLLKYDAINSTDKLNYIVYDYSFGTEINYYRLVQYDNDGKYKIYGPISIDNRENYLHIVKMINLFGQVVDQYYTGTVIVIYSDGSTKKIVR